MSESDTAVKKGDESNDETLFEVRVSDLSESDGLHVETNDSHKKSQERADSLNAVSDDLSYFVVPTTVEEENERKERAQRAMAVIRDGRDKKTKDEDKSEPIADSGQVDVDLTKIEAVEDEDGNCWQVSRSYAREPTPLGGQYRSRIILSYDGDSKKLRPQTFVDQITDGTYSVRDRR